VFVGINAKGQQLFRCRTPSATCVNGQTTQPSASDYAVIGNANPDFTLGVHSQVSWGKFDASFLVNSVVGQDVFNNTALVYSTKGNALQDKNFLRSALNDRTGIHEPAIFSSRWIENGSFVRLQNVTVGYTLNVPARFIGSARSARVYVSGDNLILLTGYSGYDPEVFQGKAPSSTNLAARGIDYLAYPHPRTITTGIRLAF
jgi:iron complex outermembrane receptor protein